MFEVYGEMSSADEINALAESLKAEQELDNLKTLAKENGIEEELAELFFSGELPFLTDDCMAAVAKLTMEAEGKGEDSLEAEIVEGLKDKADTNEDFAKKVRKKGKSLDKCIKHLWEVAKKEKKGNGIYISPRRLIRLAIEYYEV